MGQRTTIRTNVLRNTMWTEDFSVNEGNNIKKDGKPKGFTVIKDTKEKENHGWWFPAEKECLGTIEQNLKTGDYTLVGYEDVFTLERKASPAEIATNVNESRWPGFLTRMKDIPHSYIIMEFSIYDMLGFPENAKLPPWIKKKIQMNGKIILKRLAEQMLEYDVNIIWAGDKYIAQEVAMSLFKRVYEKYKR